MFGNMFISPLSLLRCRQEIAELAILKKANENHSLIADECKRCSMSLMENNGKLVCVTCPKIYLKAKQKAEMKRFEGRECLTKLEFIPHELSTQENKSSDDFNRKLPSIDSADLHKKDQVQSKTTSLSERRSLNDTYLSKSDEGCRDLGNMQDLNSLCKKVETKDGENITNLHQGGCNPVSYEECSKLKTGTLLVQGIEHSSPKQSTPFVLSEHSFESCPSLDIAHGTVIDEGVSCDESFISDKYCDMVGYQRPEKRERTKQSSGENERTGKDQVSENLPDEGKNHNPLTTASKSSMKNYERGGPDPGGSDAAMHDCSFCIRKSLDIVNQKKGGREAPTRDNIIVKSSKENSQ